MACIKSASRSALVAFARGPSSPPNMRRLRRFSSLPRNSVSDPTSHLYASIPFRGAVSSTERFNSLIVVEAVAASDSTVSRLVAGGLNDGSIGVWNPRKLIGFANAPLDRVKLLCLA
ncbi:uncharacterized protein A4U43_C05F270 [Asparagus officinalis]|uniref:Uncharacterized protein n=1 Tax=Asparagus officinalis TaxID=4686 RepID=A0A5P1EN75_ASPOF|nr:uncharacterized protein A4U43_C05F270 [Asparagus officinalis]